IPLRFQLRGAALTEWLRLQDALDSLPSSIFSAGPTSVGWPLAHSGVFSISSLMHFLSYQKFIGNPSFPSDSIWIAPIPSKIQCFCWQVFLKKIATVDNLQRRGIPLVNRCVLCGCAAESVNHIFIKCKFSSKVWNKVSSVLSFRGPFLPDVVGFISGWKGMTVFIVSEKRQRLFFIPSFGRYGKNEMTESSGILSLLLAWFSVRYY
ncbi:hypothetical protein LINGRAHAP2_LOCUS23081, partial [Linum grandiflorum]